MTKKQWKRWSMLYNRAANYNPCTNQQPLTFTEKEQAELLQICYPFEDDLFIQGKKVRSGRKSIKDQLDRLDEQFNQS